VEDEVSSYFDDPETLMYYTYPTDITSFYAEFGAYVYSETVYTVCFQDFDGILSVASAEGIPELPFWSSCEGSDEWPCTVYPLFDLVGPTYCGYTCPSSIAVWDNWFVGIKVHPFSSSLTISFSLAQQRLASLTVAILRALMALDM
jgi:hypothetical protein